MASIGAGGSCARVAVLGVGEAFLGVSCGGVQLVGVVPGRGWKSVTVPEPLYVRLRELAVRRGVAVWQLLEEMLSFWGGGGVVSCGGDLDRAAYYILKLVYSVSALKISPNRENMEWLEKTLAQLEDRLGVDCKNILPAAKKYTDNPTGKNKHTLNMTTKQCIKTIITGTLQEQQKKQ